MEKNLRIVGRTKWKAEEQRLAEPWGWDEWLVWRGSGRGVWGASSFGLKLHPSFFQDLPGEYSMCEHEKPFGVITEDLRSELELPELVASPD